MAKFLSLYRLHEVQYDENDIAIKEYRGDLPHKKEILEHVCHEWNDMHDMFLDMINEECDDRIASCRMRPYKEKDCSCIYLCVEFIAKKGKQLTGWIKDTICEFMDAQYCDGFGESVFGYRQTGEDGVVYSIE